MPGLQTYLDMYTSAGGPRAGSLGQPASAGGGNPFAGLSAAFSGGGNAGGQAPAVSPAPRYNGLLDPTKRDVFGFIGRMTGNPTREEWWAQRQGQASQAGAAGLAERIKAGMPPDRAVLDFINSPEGVDFFTTVPNASEVIKSQLSTMVAEAPEPMTVAPGNAVIQGGQEIYRNPTTETQDFLGLAEVANLDANEQAELARSALIAKQTGDLTQTQQATANLVARGLMSPEMKDKWDAGLVTSIPFMDPGGGTTGQMILDMTDPNNPRLVVPRNGIQRTPIQPGSPNYAPGVSDDGYDPYSSKEPGTYLSQLANPADVVEGAGMIPALTETAGGLADMFVPGATGWGAEAAKRRRALNQIKLDARALKDAGSDNGRYLKADIELLDSLFPNTNTLTTETYTTAADSLINYRLWLEQRLAKANAEYTNPDSTNKARGEAKLELIALDKAMANVPTVDQLMTKRQELAVKYKDQSPVGEAINKGMDAFKGIEKTGQEMLDQQSLNPVKTEFKDQAEAEAAVRANPEAYNGQTVTIGGKRMKVGVQPYAGGPK